MPEKAAVAVYDDYVEGALAVAGALDHLLEHAPLVVGRRRSRLDEFSDNLPLLRLAPGGKLSPLVRHRKVVLNLPAGRDAHVKCCTNCRIGSRNIRALTPTAHALTPVIPSFLADVMTPAKNL